MPSTTWPTDRALLALHAVVIGVLLAAGIVSAVKVDDRHSSKVAAGTSQPSLGPQAVPGAPPVATTTSLPPAPTTVPLPAVVATGVSTAGFGGSPSAASSTTLYVPPTVVNTTTTAPACTATVSNSTPQPGEKESVEVASDLDGAAVTVTVHYASGDTTYRAKTSSSGQAQVSFTVPSKALPGSVPVDALVGSKERCQTSFTIV